MLKKIGSKFLGGMVILAIIYSFASKGYISHISNSIEEVFSHKCMNLVTDATFCNTGKTYKEAFSYYFKNPDWKYFDSEKGNIIEFNGKCNYLNNEVDCTLQFLVSNDKKSFDIAYCGFNKIPQNQLIYLALMKSIEDENLGKTSTNKTTNNNTTNTNMNTSNTITTQGEDNTNMNSTTQDVDNTNMNTITQGGDTIHNNPNYVPEEENTDFEEDPANYGIQTNNNSDICY